MDGDPNQVWRAYLDQFPKELNPDLAASGLYGCLSDNPDTEVGTGPGCAAYATNTDGDGDGETGRPRLYRLDLGRPPGDVSGHFQVLICSAVLPLAG